MNNAEKIDLIEYIERETGIHGLQNKSWNSIVENAVLPIMAGGSERDYIGDKFMTFMSIYYYDIMLKNYSIYSILQQLALQRLLNGAVLHDDDYEYHHDKGIFPKHGMMSLPTTYMRYSSIFDEPQVMTQGCYDYIMSSAFDEAFKDKSNKDFAMEVAFRLINNISSQGKVDQAFNIGPDFEKEGLKLYSKAVWLVEKFGDYKTVFENYTQTNEWEKHIFWFAKNYAQIDWKMFFKNTKALKGNFINKFLQRRAIKEKIYRESLTVAWR